MEIKVNTRLETQDSFYLILIRRWVYHLRIMETQKFNAYKSESMVSKESIIDTRIDKKGGT